jgi:hypothetical protein
VAFSLDGILNPTAKKLVTDVAADMLNISLIGISFLAVGLSIPSSENATIPAYTA